jgi:hypothetical protein
MFYEMEEKKLCRRNACCDEKVMFWTENWFLWRRRCCQAGWPDEFVKKIAQNVAQPIFCENHYTACNMEK